MSSSIPPISSFSSLPTDQKIQILDTLFEPSPELHKLMIPVITHQSFSSYDSLIDAVRGRMQALSAPDSPEDRQVLYGILGSHPRLGEKKSSTSTSTSTSAATKEHMSDLSRQEQANINASSAGTAAEDEKQAERLHALNQEYENTFPGLKFVTFVNGRGRDTIMDEMRQRIDRRDSEREIDETIQAMCDIAKDRVRKLT